MYTRYNIHILTFFDVSHVEFFFFFYILFNFLRNCSNFFLPHPSVSHDVCKLHMHMWITDGFALYYYANMWRAKRGEWKNGRGSEGEPPSRHNYYNDVPQTRTLTEDEINRPVIFFLFYWFFTRIQYTIRTYILVYIPGEFLK